MNRWRRCCNDFVKTTFYFFFSFMHLTQSRSVEWGATTRIGASSTPTCSPFLWSYCVTLICFIDFDIIIFVFIWYLASIWYIHLVPWLWCRQRRASIWKNECILKVQTRWMHKLSLIILLKKRRGENYFPDLNIRNTAARRPRLQEVRGLSSGGWPREARRARR